MPKRIRLALALLIIVGITIFAILYPKLQLLLERYSTEAIAYRKFTINQTPISNPVPKKDLTKVVLLGDSMTERLGNSDIIQKYLSVYYPNRKFLILNYGYGATNILSAQE